MANNADNTISLLELIDKGNVALVEVCNCYNNLSGYSFMSYAAWKIYRAIKKVLTTDLSTTKKKTLEEIALELGVERETIPTRVKENL